MANPRVATSKPRKISHFHEAWKRSLAKALSYRALILIFDFVVIDYATGRADIALGFVLLSNIYTTVAYYAHERVWDGVKWGQRTQTLKRADPPSTFKTPLAVKCRRATGFPFTAHPC